MLPKAKKIMKHIIILFFVLNVLTGCPQWESLEKLSNIKVLINDKEQTSINIETGETITLKANAGTGSVSIVWEIDESHAEIVEIISTGEGQECVIKGRTSGSAAITVRAWRGSEDAVEVTLPVNVTKAVVTDIRIIGETVIGVGEERALNIQIVPTWADYPLQSVNLNPSLLEINQIEGIFVIEGKSAGKATLTFNTEGFTKNFEFEVKTPEPLIDINIYLGSTRITGEIIDIGVFEEKYLSVKIEPASAYTFFVWESDSTDVVVDMNGIIKGITPTGSANITVKASGKQAQITVKVGNPVNGIRVLYDNSDSLLVSNIIWLFPGDSVNLKTQLMPEGIEGQITWSGGDGAVNLSHTTGETCTITGALYSDFDSAPVLVTVSAGNTDNGRPVSVYLRIKVMANEPIWAWDRARDADLNQVLKEFASDYDAGLYRPGLPIGGEDVDGVSINNRWKLGGRGTMADQMVNVANANPIPYTPLGLNMNSSPVGAIDPAPDPANSTRIMFGTNINVETSPTSHTPGVFKLFNPETPETSRAVRISYDYEILSSNGRALWITVNNNRPTHGQSVLLNASRLTQYALSLPKGTKHTLVEYLLVPDLYRLLDPNDPGLKSLEEAFIGFIVLSNGANINLSGVRIEYE